jgi:hypothetical protein
MLSLKGKIRHSEVPSKYHRDVRDLLFSCLRSLIAYENPQRMKDVFMNQKLYKYYRLDKFNDLEDIRLDPIFYNGPKIRKNRKDVQGSMILQESNLYITFRGSNDIQDLLYCTDIRRENIGDGMYIHKGYYDQFMSIERHITSDIMKLSNEYEIKKITFAGHSLGGQLASIAAPHYSELFSGKKHICCHTFGATAVGNDKFVEWFVKRVNEHVRVELDVDLIPKIPIHESYQHLPNLIRLSDEYIDTEDTYVYDCVRFLKSLFSEDNLVNLVDNHACKRYIDILYTIYKYVKYSCLDTGNYQDFKDITGSLDGGFLSDTN